MPVVTTKGVTAAQQQIPAVSSTLTTNGFNPSSASCAAGKVMLSINNQSGIASLTLRLTRGNGEALAEYGVPSGTTEFRQEVDLQPGEYSLKELNHPGWVFQITAQ